MKLRRSLALIAGVGLVTIVFYLVPTSSDRLNYHRQSRPSPAPHSHPPPPPGPGRHDAHDSGRWHPAPDGARDGFDDERHSATGPDVAAEFGNFDATDRPLTPAGDALCARWPGRDDETGNVVLIVKTGATESFGKIPTQLATILRCVPDRRLLIFSDMEQTVAGALVRDSLDSVLDEVKAHPDFDLYRAQKACRVSQADCTRHRDRGKEGWAMDKYKNIHVAEKAYNLRPGADWYVVIDADTYLFWTTLVAFLARLDPRRKLLLGSVAHYKDFPFAHGGSGYIVSRGAMDAFVGQNPGIGNAYDKRAAEECCGDWMFSKAMNETSNIGVTQAFPTINGDKVWSMSFGPTHWCHPLATMHHVDSEEMSTFWEFEARTHLRAPASRPGEPPRPILLRDMYHEFFRPRASAVREDWTNISDDRVYETPKLDGEGGERAAQEQREKLAEWEKVAHMSLENCRRACEKTSDCFQYLYYHEQKCGISRSFKIGYPLKHEEELSKRQTSGWLLDRIDKWVAKQGECTNIIWPDVGPKKQA